MLDLELINKAAHRIYPTHLNEEAPASSFSWNAILPSAAKSTLKNSEGHKETSGRNSHTLTHKLKGGASIEFNVTGNGKNNIVMAKYQKGGKLFTAIHSHEDPHEAMSTVYHSIKKRMVTEEIESTLVEKMAKRIEKKTGKLSDKKEKIDVEPSEEKELKESAKKNQIRKFTFGKDNIHLYHSGTGETYSITPKKIVKIHTGQDTPSGYRYSDIKSGREIKRIHKLLKNAQEGNKELKESTPPGMESWVKKNRAHFVKEYGDKKGHEVLYATAWKLHNKMDEMEELKVGDHVRGDHSKGYFYGKVTRVGGISAMFPSGRMYDVTPDKEYHTEFDSKPIKMHQKSLIKLDENELNELSKKTLSSYIKQASHHARSNEYYAGVGGVRGEFVLQKKQLEIAKKRQKGIEKAVDKLAEAHSYTKEGLAKQIKYHEDRAAHHDSEASKADQRAGNGANPNFDIHMASFHAHKAVADLHRKHIYDLRSSAGLAEAEGKIEMMYLSKGFISPKLAEKLARESKHLGTDKSTGEQHYQHSQHGRIALVPHKSGEFQFRLAEEIEQLDELSPHTLGRYIKFAAIDKSKHAAHGAISDMAMYNAQNRGDKKDAQREKELGDVHRKKEDKRTSGILKATDKLVRKVHGLHGASQLAPHPDKVDLNLLKENLDHDHPDMKAYHAACKARDEAHLASIRYRMHHDIKQPEHRAKYNELETEHHRLRDIENLAAEKVHGRLFAHHALKEQLIAEAEKDHFKKVPEGLEWEPYSLRGYSSTERGYKSKDGHWKLVPYHTTTYKQVKNTRLRDAAKTRYDFSVAVHNDGELLGTKRFAGVTGEYDKDKIKVAKQKMTTALTKKIPNFNEFHVSH